MAELRPASRGELSRASDWLLGTGLFPGAADLVRVWESDPWRVSVSAAGEMALLRRHSHLPLMLVEALWCDDARVSALIQGIASVAREHDCRQVLSPFVDDEDAEPYLSAGLADHREVVSLRLEGPGRAPGTLPVEEGDLSDEDEVLALDAEVFDPFWRFDREWMRRSVPTGRLGLLRQDGSLVGYAIGRTRGPEGHIVRLAVRPAARRRGLGGALLADVLGSLASSGSTSVTVITQTDNEAALDLYGSAGFERSGGPLRVLISDML